MSSVANQGTSQERPPFDVAWQTIDGLKVRHATGGSGENIVLFSPWPESIFAFAPVWCGLVRQFGFSPSTFPASVTLRGAMTSSRRRRWAISS